MRSLPKYNLCDNFNYMVRLMNKHTVKYFAGALNGILKTQEIFTRIKSIDHPNVGSCIYAMWHGNQFCVYGIPNRFKLNVLVSNSLDGDIITNCLINLGMKAIRGSTGKKGSVGGTMQMIEALKNDDSIAIMVDGPRGPAKKVKGGIIKIAQMANVPIVPVHWYSPQLNFIKIPSWDGMTTPLGFTRIINIYGEPIYVPQNLTPEDEKVYKEKIEKSLLELEKNAPKIFEEVKQDIPWKLNLDLNYPRFN